MLLSSIALFLLAAILFAGFASSLAMAQQTTTTTTTTPSITTGQMTPPTTPPLTPQEQEQLNRLQNVIAATNQNLDETEKQIGGVVYTPRWSDPVWVEPDSAAVLIAYCLPGEFAESGQEILGGFELEVLESYEVALPQNFMAWMMVIGNEDRQDRLPAAVGVVCASDANDAQTRVLSSEEQQQINNVISQFTTTTSIDQVINIINNNNNATNQNATGGGGTAGPQVPGGAGGFPEENTTATRGDTIPPVLIVPGDIEYPPGSTEGRYLEYEVLAEDNVDGVASLDTLGRLSQDALEGRVIIECDIQSHTPMTPGVDFRVQCTAEDEAGNVATASFRVQFPRLGMEARTDPGLQSEILRDEPAADEGGGSGDDNEAAAEEQPPPVEEQPPPVEEEAATSPPANEGGG